MSDESPTPTGIHAELASAFPDEVTGFAVTADGQPITEVRPDGLFQVAAELKRRGHRILSCLSAYNTKTEGSGVFYSFLKVVDRPEDFSDVRLRVPLEFPEDGHPQVQSLVDVFPAAGWHEREMYDMYGIRFEGHPDLRRMFLPEGWTGHPQRHDYAEPEQFVAMREGEDIVVKTQEEGSW